MAQFSSVNDNMFILSTEALMWESSPRGLQRAAAAEERTFQSLDPSDTAVSNKTFSCRCGRIARDALKGWLKAKIAPTKCFEAGPKTWKSP